MPEYSAPPPGQTQAAGRLPGGDEQSGVSSGMFWQVVTLRTSALLAAWEGIAGFSAKFLKNGGFHTP